MDDQHVIFDADINWYFKIHNSPIGGGEGSTIYSKLKTEHIHPEAGETAHDLADRIIRSADGIIRGMAEMLKTAPDDITLITYEEYKENAYTDDDYDDDDE